MAMTNGPNGPGKGFGKKGEGKTYWQEPYYDYNHNWQEQAPAAAHHATQVPQQTPMIAASAASAAPSRTLFQAVTLRNSPPRISTASPMVPAPGYHQIMDQPADTGALQRQ